MPHDEWIKIDMIVHGASHLDVEEVDQHVHIGGIHDLATNTTMPHDEWISIDMIVTNHHHDESGSHGSESSNDSEWKHSSTNDWESSNDSEWKHSSSGDSDSSGTDDWESSDEPSAESFETGEDGCEFIGFEENSEGHRREWCDDLCVKSGGEWIVVEETDRGTRRETCTNYPDNTDGTGYRMACD